MKGCQAAVEGCATVVKISWGAVEGLRKYKPCHLDCGRGGHAPHLIEGRGHEPVQPREKGRGGVEHRPVPRHLRQHFLAHGPLCVAALRADEVEALADQQDLVGEGLGDEGRDHVRAQGVPPGPELVVGGVLVLHHKELLQQERGG